MKLLPKLFLEEGKKVKNISLPLPQAYILPREWFLFKNLKFKPTVYCLFSSAFLITLPTLFITLVTFFIKLMV